MSESQNQNDEIDLFDVFDFLIVRRKTLIKYILGFAIIGVLYSLDATVEYISPSKVLPRNDDSQSGSSSLLSKFGGLGGIDISRFLGGTSVTGISPAIYSEVVKSNTFIYQLLNSNFYYKGDSIRLKKYLLEEARFSILSRVPDFAYSIPSRVFKLFGTKNDEENNDLLGRDPYIQKYLLEDEEMIFGLKERISIETDPETGIMVLLVRMPSAELAAQINKKCLKKIEAFVENYRLENTQKKIMFLANQLKDAEKKLNNELKILSQLRDSNKALIASDYLLKLESQQAKYNFAFDVYSGIQQQIEQAKLTLIERKVVIDILEPARIPNEKSAPHRTLIVIAFTFLGCFIGISAVYLKEFISKYHGKNSSH